MNRTIKKQIWLSEEEDRQLKEKAEATCLTEAALIRMLIQGFLPKEKPQADFYKAMNQITAIGNNLNQIAARANTFGFADVKALECEIENLRNFRLALEKKFLEPEVSKVWQ